MNKPMTLNPSFNGGEAVIFDVAHDDGVTTANMRFHCYGAYSAEAKVLMSSEELRQWGLYLLEAAAEIKQIEDEIE